MYVHVSAHIIISVWDMLSIVLSQQNKDQGLLLSVRCDHLTSPPTQPNKCVCVCVSSGKQQWKWVSQPYYEFTSGSWHHSDRAEDMRNERSVRVRHEQTRREKSNWMRLRSPLLREQWQRQIEVDLLCASHLQNTVSPSRFAYFLVTFCLCFLFSGHCSCHVLYTLKQSIFI